jgi:hypothetical protein
MRPSIIIVSLVTGLLLTLFSCGDPDPNDPDYQKAKKEVEENMSDIKVVKDFDEYQSIIITTFKGAIKDIKNFERTDRLYGQGRTSLSSAYQAAKKAKQSCDNAHSTIVNNLGELEKIPADLQPILKEVNNNFELFYNTSESAYSKAMDYYETGKNKKAFNYAEDIEYANFYLGTAVKNLNDAFKKQGKKLNIKIFTD